MKRAWIDFILEKSAALPISTKNLVKTTVFLKPCLLTSLDWRLSLSIFILCTGISLLFLAVSWFDFSHVSRPMIFAGILTIVISFGVSLFIGRRSVSQLKDLVLFAGLLSEGNQDQCNIESTNPQLTQLVKSLNSLASLNSARQETIEILKQEIATIVQENDSIMSKLVSSAIEQATSVSKTASAVAQMERTAEGVSENAEQIVSVADKTHIVSARGMETVKKTAEIVSHIKEDAEEFVVRSREMLAFIEEIFMITQTVKSISEQSKILSVNAAIQAAKAGKYGAGFSIIAKEVKALAQESNDATFKITGTLNRIRYSIKTIASKADIGKKRTEESVYTIADAGAAMEDLLDAIQENSKFAHLIADNIQGQASGLSEISTAIEKIGAVVMENVETISSAVNEEKSTTERSV